MLELHDLSLQVGNADDPQFLLADVSAQFPKRHFAAILGPSGCGKSTLLKVIAGLQEASTGSIYWSGRDLVEEGDFDPHEIGYVPQFSIAYDGLTVWESVDASLCLRVAGLSGEEADERIEQILKDVGLDEIADRRVALLSGGQKRRLALALEMVSNPNLLICDEVTSGLDPKSEDEIVRLMHQLSRSDDRIVLSVTHSLRHISLYDSVIVLYQGRVAYHGAPATLLHYFGIENHEELYPRLAMRKAEDWHRSWLKHRNAYYETAGLHSAESLVAAIAANEEGEEKAEDDPKDRLDRLFNELQRGETPEIPEATPETTKTGHHHEIPSTFTQFSVLLSRRWKLFFRDRSQLLLQAALLFGFPFLVVIFALDGLPALKSLADSGSGNFLQQLQNEIKVRSDAMQTGSLVSGLIMFQVVLLALMGSNNAAREIAGERLIFEKEKFAGVSPMAYVMSKVAFLGVLVLAQSLWMGVFVNMIVRFPGDLTAQLALLVLVNAAITSICLAVSSLMKTAEQASLVSIYLVGFQLPLSGAVLALPKAINTIAQPFIASYWGWSGFIQTMRDTRFYDAIQLVTQTHLSAVPMCLWALACHVIVGVFVAIIGSKNSRWD